MAIYEYKCKSCEKKFELMRKVGDRDSKASCPTCPGSGERIVWQRVSMVSGVAPDLLAGDGEPEDFIGEDSDFDGLDDFDF